MKLLDDANTATPTPFVLRDASFGPAGSRPEFERAASCLSRGVRELLTMDRDFSRYPSLGTRSLLS